jgi:ABC-type phosphate transport system substrate-binding protein
MGERTGANADGSQSRNQVPRFGATDDPPSTTGVSQMNQGTDAVGDEGTIHVIPTVVGGVALAVNFPNNCDRSLLNDASETHPSAANASPFDDRVRFTRTQAEAIMNGGTDADNWTDVFPELAADADCNVPITRVVRFDDSGTTYALKDWLDHVNSGRGWKTTYITPDTRTWPNATVSSDPGCGGTTGPHGTNLISGCANGNGPLIDKLKVTDGSVGYADVATARAKGLDITPATSAGSRDDDVFWTQTTNPNGQFVEPTADPDGFRTDGLHGANCQQTAFSGVPSSTLGDWNATSGVDSTNGGWVICTLSYELAFDDYKGPYSLQGCGDACEEQKARSVRDFLSSIVSDAGQELLFNDDYAPLPEAILGIARAGVDQICWNKAGTGGCPGTIYGYPRPKGATPILVSLVPAYDECTTGTNRQHGPPLDALSCSASPSTQRTRQSSGFLTVGTADAWPGTTPQSAGIVRYDVKVGNPSTPANDADVRLVFNVTDVRNAPSLTDYTGQVQVNQTVQITDKYNGASLAQPATTQELDFPVTASCTGTADTAIGSACGISTTFNAVVPSAIRESKRTMWQLGQVVVNDGGADGVVSTTPNTVFEKQGIWVP